MGKPEHAILGDIVLPRRIQDENALQSFLVASHRLSREIGVYSCLLCGGQHVLAIRAVDVSSREVVANTVPSSHGRVHGARCTILSSTADLGRADPDDLGVVTPCLEICEIRVGLTVGTGRVQVELAIVPHLGDGLGHDRLLSQGRGIGRRVHGNVLAVTATAGSEVMRKLARSSDSGGIASVSVAPGHGRRRVVCAVDVVVIDGSAGQVGWLSSSLDSAAAGTGRGPGEVCIDGDSDHWNFGGGGRSEFDVGGLVGSNGLDGGDFLDDSVVDNVSLGDNFDLGQGRGDRGASNQQE